MALGIANSTGWDRVAVRATAEPSMETLESHGHFLSMRFAGAEARHSQCPL